MSGWEPGPNPVPEEKIERITDLAYVGELNFVRHAKVHLDKPPKSLWQLTGDFSATMTVHPKTGAAYALTITAPRAGFIRTCPRCRKRFGSSSGRSAIN